MTTQSLPAAVSAAPFGPVPTFAGRVAAAPIGPLAGLPGLSLQRFPGLEVLPQPAQDARPAVDLFVWRAREQRATEVWEDLISAVFLLCGIAAVVVAFS